MAVPRQPVARQSSQVDASRLTAVRPFPNFKRMPQFATLFLPDSSFRSILFKIG